MFVCCLEVFIGCLTSYGVLHIIVTHAVCGEDMVYDIRDVHIRRIGEGVVGIGHGVEGGEDVPVWGRVCQVSGVLGVKKVLEGVSV